MTEKLIWLTALVCLYWGYCLVMGWRGSRLVRSATDYFIAGHRTSLWVLILAATAASFSGWTLIGHPGLLFRDGFPYAYVSFFAIVIPFTGVVFLKRQWMLGKRFGYVTPGEMLSEYFQGDTIRILTVGVALLFSIPYVAVQLAAAGLLVETVTDGLVAAWVGAGVLALAILLYVTGGGTRSVAYVDSLQCVLLALGFVATGLIALHAVGGWDDLQEGLGLLAATPGADRWAGHDHVSFFALQGIVDTGGGESLGGLPGSPWSSLFVLTFLWALMGIQAAPAFSMWAFGTTDPRPFAIQQVWASAFGIGFLLVVFAAIQGMGAHLLGANPGANRDTGLWTYMLAHEGANEITAWDGADGSRVSLATAEGWRQALTDRQFARMVAERQIVALAGAGDLAARRDAGDRILADLQAGTTAAPPDGVRFFRLALPEATAARPDTLVPAYFNLIGDSLPWLVGLLGACALAAMQTTGAALIATTGSILTRDLYRGYLRPRASHHSQRLFGRVAVSAVLAAALLVAWMSTDALVLLGGFAVAFGAQMWLALAAACYLPWITRQGATWGLAAGLLAVLLTDAPGPWLLHALGLPSWERWPLGIHSAGWGILFNAGVTVLLSAATQSAAGTSHRRMFHQFLAEHTRLPARKRWLVPVGWIATVLWTLFAVGPAAMLGNTLFGIPADAETWLFGMPSIWVWQGLFWLLGVGLLWLLAVKLEMSTVPAREVEALLEDVADPPHPGLR